MFLFTKDFAQSPSDSGTTPAAQPLPEGASLGSIFTARRDLVKAIRELVIHEFDLSMDESELLIELFGASRLESWEMKVDEEGWVTAKQLKEQLVHDRTLLSRRLAKLAKAGLIESRKLWETKQGKTGQFKNLHGNSQMVRITEAGTEKIAPIWELYGQLETRLMEGISPEQRRIHYEVNQSIRKRFHAMHRLH
jgi:DNA-binding MarR family transcriptional regulator